MVGNPPLAPTARDIAKARTAALRTLSIVVIALAVVVGILTSRQVTESRRTRDTVAAAVATVQRTVDLLEQQLQADCRFYRDLTGVPLQATSSPALLRIIADARNTYAGRGCAALLGTLPPADPRVRPFLN